MGRRLRLALLIVCGALVLTAAVALVASWRGGRHVRDDLLARRAVLLREVEGLRDMARASANGLAIPPEDVAIAVEDTLVRDLIGAQLPFDADLERFHVVLTRASVEFRGRPLVGLRGSGYLRSQPKVAAALEVHGSLQDLRVDSGQGTLRARIVIDEVTIEKAAGLESVLSGPLLQELEHEVRLRLQDLLPTVEIPVQIRQQVQLPAVTSGPVRIEGAAVPLQVSVSRVFAGMGRLWIGVSIRAGEPVHGSSAGAAP